MPIYEYRCHTCGRRVSLFVRTLSGAESPRCPLCGGEELTRLISRVTVLRSWGESLDRVPDPESFTDVDEDDPRETARWLRRIRQELGDEAGQLAEEALYQAGLSPEDLDESPAEEGEEGKEGGDDADL